MSETIARAYVQIAPSTQGIGSALKSELSGAGTQAGNAGGLAIGKGILSKLAALGVGVAIGKAIGASINEGAALQQSLGGVETLFKKNADTVVKNAQVAYKTAGVSANTYMEGVTSFAASLLQSTAGNTKKAADISDMAFRDMSDNVNKFGSNFADIQHAYQGFAKQNYTMLDNLKLGYGGTKAEMERLLTDAEKLSGQKYDISSLADVYNAIHVVQEELGVTGTTAKEASTTFTGSFEAMKAAAANMAGAMTTEGMDAGEAFMNLAKSVGTFLKGGLAPLIVNFAKSIPSLVQSALVQLPALILTELQNTVTAVQAQIASFFNAIPLSTLLASISNKITEFLASAVEQVDIILDNITMAIQGKMPAETSKIITTLQTVIPRIVAFILNNAGKFLVAVAKITVSIGTAIIKNAPTIISQALRLVATLIATVVGAVLKHDWAATGRKAISLLVTGLRAMIGAVGSAGASIASAAVRGVQNIVSGFFSVGQNIVRGLVNGITSGVSWVTNAVASLGSKALEAVKKILHIGSPSKEFEKIGDFCAQGFALGFESPTVERGAKSMAQRALKATSVRSVTPAVSRAESYGGGEREIRIVNYLYPNGQKLDETVYRAWNRGRKVVGNV